MVHKYKWHGIIPSCALMLVLAVFSSFLPKVYKSECLIEVDRGKIENPLQAPSERAPNMMDHLTVFAENCVKWSTLAQVVDKVGANVILENSDKYNIRKLKSALAFGGKQKQSAHDEYLRKEGVIALLKSEITFRQKPPKFLLIEYTGTAPRVNADILNTLFSTMVEEKTKAELIKADQSYEFIKNEMETYKKKLEGAETNLREFKEQHIAGLPTDMNMNMTQLVNDRSQLLASELELKELAGRVKYSDAQMKKQNELLISVVTQETNPMLAALNQRIIDMEIDLTRMRTNYTELHPRVIELESQLEDLKKKRDGSKQATLARETNTLNPTFQQFAQEKQDALLRSEALRNRIVSLNERIAQNEEKVKSMPLQEQQLLTLTRNYEVNANIYNMFLQKLEEARLHEKLVTETSGQEAFQVLEYARPGLSPVAPAKLKLLLIILLLGAGSGVGIVAGLNYLDDSIKSIDEAKEFLGKPLLGTVPSLVERSGNGSIHKFITAKMRRTE
jgi:polysaccharide chain length determinant protein (PEP-CTERM system associated)